MKVLLGLWMCLSLGCASAQAAEKWLDYSFEDGVKIRVHYDEEILKEAGADAYFPQEVLDAAVTAYQTITDFLGFNSEGFSFARPNLSYAYDPDRTLDIFLGLPAKENPYRFHGQRQFSFKDAPCFDTLKLSEHEYEAVILLPANYREFIKNWERINPSPLGTRNVEVDLRGTLIHEMLHAVLFYYNKNLNKDMRLEMKDSKQIDWYVEGLARYFETFVGARHDFFSQGFKQTLPDKIRFSRGGCNYFMRYPDQAFTELRYENAIFWKFIGDRYGMKAIERLSREFRDSAGLSSAKQLERVLGVSFKEVLKKFSEAILSGNLGLKEDGVYLKSVAKTHLVLREDGFRLLDGFGEEKKLGDTCATDWIGRWEGERAAHGDPPVAGDNTEDADVSGWASDFIRIDWKAENSRAILPWLGVKNQEGVDRLAVQAFLVTRGGFWIQRELGEVLPGQTGRLDLQGTVVSMGLASQDIETVYLIITNLGFRNPIRYEIIEKPSIFLTS
jgi:hypothetical protein